MKYKNPNDVKEEFKRRNAEIRNRKSAERMFKELKIPRIKGG